MTVPDHPERLARVGSVLALVGSVIWLQWPIDTERFNIAAVVFFVAALATWVAIELADFLGDRSFNDNILSDDVEKLNVLLGFITAGQFYVLRNKAIQTYMDDDDYEGLLDLISYAERDIFRFHNEALEASYRAFSAKASEFYRAFYLLYTSDGRGHSTWRPRGDGYVSDEVFERIQTRIGALDGQASELATLWEKFILLARRELKGSSRHIRQYEL
nr:hypothetical protein RTCK_03600 [Rhizobium sp. TCK]